MLGVFIGLELNLYKQFKHCCFDCYYFGEDYLTMYIFYFINMHIALLCLKINVSSIGGSSNSTVMHIIDIQVNNKTR